MDAPSLYALGSSAWLAIQAIPLLFTPKVIISLIAPEDNHISSTTEIYLSRLLALALLGIAGFALFSTQQSSPPYTVTFVHVASFVYMYTHYLKLTNAIPTSPGQASSPNTTGLILGLVGYGLLSCVGIFTVVFTGTAAHVSKRTGADKRTSGWPFGNVNAYNPKEDRKRI